jgi:hypothetical protein
LVPLLVLSVLDLIKARQIGLESISEEMVADTAIVLDRVDRSLFERYGDVQAFAVNRVLHEKQHWYHPGSQANPIADVFNSYARLYGV